MRQRSGGGGIGYPLDETVRSDLRHVPTLAGVAAPPEKVTRPSAAGRYGTGEDHAYLAGASHSGCVAVEKFDEREFAHRYADDARGDFLRNPAMSGQNLVHKFRRSVQLVGGFERPASPIYKSLEFVHAKTVRAVLLGVKYDLQKKLLFVQPQAYADA